MLQIASETDLRIHLLNAWRESAMFTDRERAALNWTETLTNIAGTGASDADYSLLSGQFDVRRTRAGFSVAADRQD